jgi:peptidoglycan lytic transglycosylase F
MVALNVRRALLAVVGCLVAASAVADDLAAFRARGRLRVLAVVSGEQAYFIAGTPGLPPGFDAEVLGAFARLHKLALEVVPVAGWDGLIPALLQGQGEVIAGGYTVTERRRAHIAFTTEVFPTRTVAMNRRPRPPLASVGALRGEKVGTVKGTFMVEDLASAGVGAVDDSIPAGGLAQALRSGRITVAVDGLEAALVAQARDHDIQIGPFLGPPSALAYGVRKEDTALLRALDAFIVNMRRTSTWNRLAVKYFGSSAPAILRKARGE